MANIRANTEITEKNKYLYAKRRKWKHIKCSIKTKEEWKRKARKKQTKKATNRKQLQIQAHLRGVATWVPDHSMKANIEYHNKESHTIFGGVPVHMKVMLILESIKYLIALWLKKMYIP